MKIGYHFLFTLMVYTITTSTIYAQEEYFQFRTLQDQQVPVDVCENAPFYEPSNPPNVLLGANVWSTVSETNSGSIVNDQVKKIGIAKVCAWVTSLGAGDQAPLYIQFNIGDLPLSASGNCTVISNDVPVAGLILVGCNLKVPESNELSIIGGSLTSNSVFNPANLSGFQTGSVWTLHLYY